MKTGMILRLQEGVRKLRGNNVSVGTAWILGLGLLLAASAAGSAEQSLVGSIGDSHCGAKAHPTESRGRKISGRECIVGTDDGVVPGCLRNGGKFVLVVGDKVYQITNQDFAGLRENAAQNVRVMGELTGDTITLKTLSAVNTK